MAVVETPITLEDQITMIKKYVSFTKKVRMRRFLQYAGYFRASRYGKYLLSFVEEIGYKPNQDDLFKLYDFDVKLRRVLNYYCNVVEIRFKNAIANTCSLEYGDGTFYLDKKSYTPSKGESDANTRKRNIRHFNKFYNEIVETEKYLRTNTNKYPELKEYRKGGGKHKNKLPIWVTFAYSDFGTVTTMYSYLNGDLRKKILKNTFNTKKYSKGDATKVDTWLASTRTVRNYCAHNSMVVGMTSSVVLTDSRDDADILIKDNDLFSRLYALKKLLPNDEKEKLKNDVKEIVSKSKMNVYLLNILPSDWEEQYDRIVDF